VRVSLGLILSIMQGQGLPGWLPCSFSLAQLSQGSASLAFSQGGILEKGYCPEAMNRESKTTSDNSRPFPAGAGREGSGQDGDINLPGLFLLSNGPGGKPDWFNRPWMCHGSKTRWPVGHHVWEHFSGSRTMYRGRAPLQSPLQPSEISLVVGTGSRAVH
jgi:hypothetical protein